MDESQAPPPTEANPRLAALARKVMIKDGSRFKKTAKPADIAAYQDLLAQQEEREAAPGDAGELVTEPPAPVAKGTVPFDPGPLANGSASELALLARHELERLNDISAAEYGIAVGHLGHAETALRRAAEELRFAFDERDRADAVLARQNGSDPGAVAATARRETDRQARRRVIAFIRRRGADPEGPQTARPNPINRVYASRTEAVERWSGGGADHQRVSEGGRFVIDRIVLIPDDDGPLTMNHPSAETIPIQIAPELEDEPDGVSEFPAPAGDAQADPAS